MAEYLTSTYDDANLYLFPDPKALQDVINAHAQLDSENEPLVLCGADYAEYIESIDSL